MIEPYAVVIVLFVALSIVPMIVIGAAPEQFPDSSFITICQPFGTLLIDGSVTERAAVMLV